MENQGQLLETVASTLSAAGMHDKAGEFYEEMNQLQRAMDRCVCVRRSVSAVVEVMWLRRIIPGFSSLSLEFLVFVLAGITLGRTNLC